MAMTTMPGMKEALLHVVSNRMGAPKELLLIEMFRYLPTQQGPKIQTSCNGPTWGLP